MSRGMSPNTMPYLDRRTFRPGEPVRAKPLLDLSELDDAPILIGQKDNTEELKKKTSIAKLKLNSTQMEKLKNMANFPTNGVINGRNYTRYEALTAHIWRSACKARKHNREQETALVLQ